ncbi:hypothetical protein FRX31_030132 [Thalictrum thalictroides]|uniref:DUF3741 domain-containing protein n=1 Tax=Thalictrum thalictroides TaxID=46969 RepID=A0A7J6V684_THATH|nr:hypothetical protein FRX31_030132 [Thalictrum thalictroides]
MAKKPDFAQKLLDDLRLKKEWMTNSQNSSRLMAEKYRDFKHPCGESREIGSTMRDMIRWSGNSTRSFATGEPSSELVSVGRVRSSEHIADLSMALAFALKNGVDPHRKYSSNNTVGFPNHLKGKSLDFRERGGGFNLDKRQPLNGPFPTLSHLHVKEISRGAQKLNQILTACYNGINFDIYPTDIAKELLKGAIDLEESLQMLVELQEASEYMISPQRKQKIRLIELEDHSDNRGAKENKQKQLDRPSFSFDPPSRKPLEYAGGSNQNSAKQKMPALSYPKETPQVSSRKQAPSASKLATHRRSSSCSPDFSTAPSLSTPTKHSSLSDSRPDRGRIPNIIAKLMGLEELPPSKESVGARKEPHVDQGARAGNNLKKNLKRNTKQCEPLSLDSEKFAHRTATQKIRQDHNFSSVPETSIIVYAGKIGSTQNHFERDVGERKCRVSKITEDTDILSNSKKSTVKINKLEISTANVHSNRMSKSVKKKRDEDPHLKEQMNKRRAEANKALLKEGVQKVAQKPLKSSETTMAKQERTETQKDAVYKEKRSVNYRFVVTHNLEKHPHPSHSANTLQKSKFQDAKFQQTNSEQPKAKQQLQVRNRSEKRLQHPSITTHDSKGLQKMLPLINHYVPAKNTSTESSDAMPSKVLMGRSHHEDLSGERYATSVGLNKQRGLDENLAEQRSFTRDIKTNVQNVTAPSAPALIKNPQQIPSTQKVDNAQVHKSVNPTELEEAVVKENVAPCNMDQSLKEQFTVVEEPKRSRHDRNEMEESILGSKETEASIKLLDSTQELQKDVDCTFILSSQMEEETPRLNKFEIYAPNATVSSSTMQIENITTIISSSQEAHLVSPNETQALMSSNAISVPIEGFHDSKNVEISSLQGQQAVPKIETPRTLTENQNYLKQILVGSQLFLNAAEALFGLQISVGILHSTGHNYPDEDNKVLLDCGYEVLRRKGRRKEFTFHPWATNSIGSSRIRCLDDLVEELHEDFETLKFCTEHGSNEHDPANSLHELLQKDIQGSKPDVNCMWDLGWGAEMFTYLEKDEVIKDVEKYVLNGLLDDVTRDLLHVTTVF